MSFIWNTPLPEPDVEIISLQDKADKLMDKIHADVERIGWSAIYVFADEGSLPFIYTIGLKESFDHPELIIYGVESSKHAHGMIACAIELIREGVRFEDGVRYGKIMQDPYEMLARDHPAGPPLNWANHYYGEPVEVVQLVWPDAEGVFPGEEGFEEGFVGWQDQMTEDV